ncbi:hypothetical protein DQ04_13601000 [Trypanosoma grayi]|uniref:hypothetical protein n=1 Tax=Trypanosoma grayi TaxID=71804 RepID=UPI0004F4AB6E|nr:hypothetical protein DQ04_13601000 [Trypanosoma grayi]KEG06504.1 hypothetical protein DQ04_13601000 [Trypanosoma grayi]
MTGLTAFMQEGALQSSAIESLDLSKNLIDTPVNYTVGEEFTCLQDYEQQLVLTRVAGLRPGSAPTAPRVRGRILSLDRPKESAVSSTSAARGAPTTTAAAKATAATGGDVPVGVGSTAAPAEDSAGPRPPSASLTFVSNVGVERGETTLQVGQLEVEGSSLQDSLQAPRSTSCLSPETVDQYSSSRRQEFRSSPCLPPFHVRQKQPSKRQSQQPEPSHHQIHYNQPQHYYYQHHHHHQQQPQQQQLHQGGTPFFPPLLFSQGGEQQWCGVPLYVPLPFPSQHQGPLPMAPLTGIKESHVAGTTSPSPPPPPPPESGARSPSLGLFSVDNHEDKEGEGDGAAFEKMMTEPLRAGEWELAEWKEKEQRFLEALVVRVESHENATAEMIERNYQATCERLNAVKDELAQRIRETLEEQRREREQLRDELREGLATEQQRRQQEESPEEVMSGQLAQLIHTGMKHIHEQMEKPASAGGGVGGAEKGVRQPARDYLREVSDRLRSLGW